MNLASVIDAHPDDAVALVQADGETTVGDAADNAVTYGELRERCAGLRGGLGELGIESGDRVALVAGNSIDFVTSYLAILGVGAVAVPLNPQSPPLELGAQVAQVGASVTAPADLYAAGPKPVLNREPDDLAVLMFTSGTAGPPRPARLSHGNLLANIEQLQQISEPQLRSDVVFGVLPFSHIYGLNTVLGMSLATGSKLVLVDRFEPETAVATIQQHSVSVVVGVPTMWSALAAAPSTAKLSLRHAVSGAAPLTSEVRQAVHERLGIDLTEGYGLTEASPAVTTGIGAEAPDGSVGMPLPGLEMRLVDAEGQDALVDDPGEIWVRGPNVFSGYWNDPGATSNALDADGWLRTGDVAVVDEDGFLYLVDRAKDLIIVSGFNVFPAEVEEVLTAHPAIREAAVQGVPHPRTGETVHAYVVAEDGADPDHDELIAFCCERLARYKCPTELIDVEQLPHGPAGKLIRRRL